MHLREGSLLQGGKYRIIRFIAAGGYGCTYEASHELLEKRVAIKEFFPEDFCNRDGNTGHVSVATDSKRELVGKMMRKFFEEARAVSRMKHSGIVSVSDVFEENGTAYFVMDYIDGASLGDIVKTHGPLSEDHALRYIRQVCAALNYVHAQNRLHLDIKPGNIMVDCEDHAILIDFGVSKQYDAVSGENTSTRPGYTPGFAPPEQSSGNVRKFLPATDIYALGATLYYLLTGIVPPVSNDRISGDEQLQPLLPYISDATKRAVYAALALPKSDRPQSVAAFASLLDSAPMSKSEPVKPDDKKTQPIDDEPGKPGKPWYKRYAAVIAIAAVVAIVGIIYLPYVPIGCARYATVIEYEDSVNYQAEEVVEAEIATTGSYNGHDWVDLGLSVKWATCNVGASSPMGYGDYYAWGETSTKSEYTRANSHTFDNSNYNFNICGNSSYDVARYKWGSPWRLPSASEIDELLNNCTWEWTTMNGVSGYKVKSKRNSNYIFLPAAGWRYGSSFFNRGSGGDYWSGTPYESNSGYACCLYFCSGNHYRGWHYRYYGRSVRPVAE